MFLVEEGFVVFGCVYCLEERQPNLDLLKFVTHEIFAYMSSRQASIYCMEGHTIRTEFTRLSVQRPGCSCNESGIKFLATTFALRKQPQYKQHKGIDM